MLGWLSLEALFEVFAHAWLEDVYVVLEPHQDWVDAADEKDRAHRTCGHFQAKPHLLLVELMETLKPIVLVSSKRKGVMLLIH